MSEEDRIRNLMMLDYSQLIMYTANLEELNDINRKEIERLKQENIFLKQLIPDDKKYSYGIRVGSDENEKT